MGRLVSDRFCQGVGMGARGEILALEFCRPIIFILSIYSAFRVEEAKEQGKP